MKRSLSFLYSAQIVASVAAAAAAYLLMPPPSRRGHVTVITGGSRGLGLALAERFGRAGCRLVLAARHRDELERARSLLLERNAVAREEDVLLVEVDLTDPEQAKSLISQTIHHFGTIDILINNAGIIEVGPAEDQSLSAYSRAMQTNFFAALYTTYAALPHLLERRSPSSNAAIVNIASIGGKFAMPHLLPYVASKFALVGFSEGLHAELRHKGIRVTTVCPGVMRTGGHVQALFSGDQEKEYRWFAFAATTPGLSASTQHAANRVFNAVVAGCAEITITPQAWLAARLNGVAPGVTSYLGSLANQYLLPAATGNRDITKGFSLAGETGSGDLKMQQVHNQQPLT